MQTSVQICRPLLCLFAIVPLLLCAETLCAAGQLADVQVSTPDGSAMHVCGGEVRIHVDKVDQQGNLTTNGTVTVTLASINTGDGMLFWSSSALITGVKPAYTMGPGVSSASFRYHAGTMPAAGAARLYIRNGDGVLLEDALTLDQLEAPAHTYKSYVVAESTPVSLNVGGYVTDFEVAKYDKRCWPTWSGDIVVYVSDMGAGPGMRIFCNDPNVTGTDYVLTIPNGTSSATIRYQSGNAAALTAAVLHAEIDGAPVQGSGIPIQQTGFVPWPVVAFLTSPGDTECGASFNPDIQVRALDALGQPIANTSISLSVAGASLSGPTSVQSDVNGIALFSGLGINATPGTYTMTASMTGAQASKDFEVLTSTQKVLQFVQQPTNLYTGDQFSPTVSVSVHDQCNIPLPNLMVSLSISGGATLSGNTTVATDANGLATFNGLAASGASGNYVLTASAGAETLVSSSFSISPQPTAVNLKFILEGTANNSNIPPYMHTYLRQLGYLPLVDPYTGASSVSSFSSSIVDWIQLEFRVNTAPNSAITTAVGLLRNDGLAVAEDGLSQIRVDAALLPPGNYYVVARHRNHLYTLTSSPILLSAGSSALYDFTPSQSRAYMNNQQPMNNIAGLFGYVAGDANVNGNERGIINALDRASVNSKIGAVGYHVEDVNLDGVVNAADDVQVLNNTFRVTQVP